MMASPRGTRAGRWNGWREGWPVVAAAALGYGTGGAMLLLTAGLFILPMRQSLGWSTRAVAIMPIVALVMALSTPFAGRLIDRIGSRRAAILGTSALGGVVAALALAPIGAVTLYGAAVLMGMVASLTIVPTYSRAVATWFSDGPGLAFGVTLSGSAAVAIVALPSINAAIAAYGWRAGYLTMAGIMLGIGLPAVLLGYRERDTSTVAKAAAAPEHGDDSTLAEALRGPRFWVYLLTFSISCIGTGGFTVHLQPLLIDQGLANGDAVGIGVAFVLAMSLGKIGGGMMLDRFQPFMVAAALMGMAGIGAVGMAHVHGAAAAPIATIAACLIGLGQGAEADFLAFFGLRAFGLRAFSSILGVFAMATTVTVSGVAFAFAWIVDISGSYGPACYLAATCLAVSSFAFIGIGFYENRLLRRPTITPSTSATTGDGNLLS